MSPGGQRPHHRRQRAGIRQQRRRHPRPSPAPGSQWWDPRGRRRDDPGASDHRHDRNLATSLGIEAVGEDGRHQTERLLAAGRPVPTTDERTDFTTIEDGQSELEIRILAGSADRPADNDRLATFTLHDVAEYPAGEPTFRVRFTVDETGRLVAEVIELETGAQATETTTAPLAN